MWDFFIEGGFGMWAILFIGLGLLAATGRFVAKPEKRRLAFIGSLALATTFSMLYTTVVDLGTVFGVIANPDKIPTEQMSRILLQGLKECTRPMSFGLVILTVAALLFAAGLARLPSAAPQK